MPSLDLETSIEYGIDAQCEILAELPNSEGDSASASTRTAESGIDEDRKQTVAASVQCRKRQWMAARWRLGARSFRMRTRRYRSVKIAKSVRL